MFLREGRNNFHCRKIFLGDVRRLPRESDDSFSVSAARLGVGRRGMREGAASGEKEKKNGGN